MVDTLPPTAAFISASNPACINTSGVVSCNLGTLGIGASTSVDIVAQPTASQSITNSVTVSGNETDANFADNVSQDTVLVAAYGMCTTATFSGPINYEIGNQGINWVATGDFNEDGFVDVVATDNER